MIDENKLIEGICNHDIEIPDDLTERELNVFLLGLNEKQIVVMDEIKNQPKVGEWIPVSERLPELESLEEFKEYIVMIEDATYPTTLFYEGDEEWRDMEGDCYIVKAWQPLPEPYKEGDN